MSQAGCIQPLCDILGVGDNKVIEVALDALENILRVGKELGGDVENPYADTVEECQGQSHTIIVYLSRYYLRRN